MGVYGLELEKLASLGPDAARRLSGTAAEALSDLFAALIITIELGQEHVSIAFRTIELRRFLEWKGSATFCGRTADWSCSDARHVLEVPVRAISDERTPVINLSRRDPETARLADPKLVALLVKARKAMQLVEENRESSPSELAAKLRCRPAHFSRLVRLNYLAPDIIAAIHDGEQPASFTQDLLFMADLPLDWSIQRKLFGFPAPAKK